MADLVLSVGGRRYEGWKSVRVTRSIERLAGSFDLGVSDRWGGQEESWPIGEEDACRVEIDGTVVIDGFVDRRSIQLTETDRILSYAGRDRAAALVDSCPVLPRWTFRNATILDVAKAVAEPLGVRVRLAPGVVLPPAQRKLAVHPGESAFEALLRAAAATGVLLVSDGAGGIVITRSGIQRAATPLVEGDNVRRASASYDGTDRFRRYVVLTQVPGTDEAAGDVTRVRAEATDPGVRRAGRVLVIRPESGITTDYARKRADWEARIRAARSETVSVVVVGWTQPRGGLWPVNALVSVRIPAIGVNGDMLIAEVEHTLAEGVGEITEISLVRPDAFTPEPAAATVKTGGAAWKELAGGV